MEKTIIIPSTISWKLKDVLRQLINGVGWKGFSDSRIDSKECKLEVTVAVSIIKEKVKVIKLENVKYEKELMDNILDSFERFCSRG